MATTLIEPPPAFIDWRKKNPKAIQSVAAPIFNVNKSTISRWDAWIRLHDPSPIDWDPPPRDFPDSHWDLTTSDLPALLTDFLTFRGRHFKTPSGKAFLTTEFQTRWIIAFLKALVTGGRLVILSPPRHGKTELLIHFCTWLIVRFPMIRILWVGGNEKIARRSVSAVATHLTTNLPLIEETLPPNHFYRPDRKDGLSWSKNEFTVATRPFPIKGASMTGLGRGGTLLSLDADLIVADDIEDHSSTTQPGNREATRGWWTTDLESRKEEQTALCKIGSRQHPDDLDSRLIENDEYEVIVETAHDSACTIPDDSDSYPLHIDCLLFPEIRTFRWLMKQRQAAETTGGRHTFEMVYLNISHPEGMVIFTPDTVNKGLDRTRSIGDIPANTRLVAGLDPSGTGYQAAFLWALQLDTPVEGDDDLPFKLFMVDTENNVGGGIKEARRVMSEWREQYKVQEWVVEETMWASGLSQDHELMDWASRVGISIEGHLTYCVDMETEVLTRSGWKQGDKLVIGEEIYTVNPDTGLGEWKPTTDRYLGHYSGPMMSVEGRNLSVLCTPDHSWLVSWLGNKGREGGLRMSKAHSLTTNEGILLGGRLSQPWAVNGDWSISLVEIIGWILTEGWLEKTGKGIRIAQSPTANPEHCKRIEWLLDDLEVDWGVSDNGQGVNVYRIPGELALRLRQILTIEGTLHFSIAYELTSGQREALIETMLAGDGHGQTFFSTTPEHIALFEMLCAMEGYATRTSEFNNGTHTKFNKTKTCWQVVRKTSPRAWVSRQKIDWVDWSGTVWCPTTANGTFLARRRGRTYVTGNTNKWDRFIGVSAFVSMYLADPIQISLPYLDAPSMQKSDAYRNQLIHFSSAGDTKSPIYKHRAGTKTDLVMASWFPMDKIRRARSDVIAEMGVEYTESFVSFPESEWDTPPWGTDDIETLLHPLG